MQYFPRVVLTSSSFWCHRGRSRRAGAILLLLWLSGCVRTELPDPRQAAEEYRRAVEAGDARAVRGLLSQRAQSDYSEAEVGSLLDQHGVELRAMAKSVTSPQAQVEGSARMQLADRREARLTLENSSFWVTGTSALPLRSEQPQDVLSNLSEALSSRSLSLFLSLLTEEQRTRVEERIDALLEALAQRDGAVVHVRGDRAEVELSDGQRILLRREGESWQIEAMP